MNIAEILTKQVRQLGHQYTFISSIESTKTFDERDNIIHNVTIKLRCISEKHNTFYDVIVLHRISNSILEVNVDSLINAFNYEIINALAFGKPTLGKVVDITGTPVKSLRDILDLVLTDKELPI